ncbi:unnamed protein product, partial [Scytosiphon promiscuus]
LFISSPNVNKQKIETSGKPGTVEEKRQASRILPLVSRHHFLLVTLLLFNSLANE